MSDLSTASFLALAIFFPLARIEHQFGDNHLKLLVLSLDPAYFQSIGANFALTEPAVDGLGGNAEFSGGISGGQTVAFDFADNFIPNVSIYLFSHISSGS